MKALSLEVHHLAISLRGLIARSTAFSRRALIRSSPSSRSCYLLTLFDVAEALVEKLSVSRYRANSQLRSRTTYGLVSRFTGVILVKPSTVISRLISSSPILSILSLSTWILIASALSFRPARELPAAWAALSSPAAASQVGSRTYHRCWLGSWGGSSRPRVWLSWYRSHRRRRLGCS